MYLDHPFYKFPFTFDTARLRQEIDAIPESAWCKHPQGFEGNTGLPLISTDGGINDDFLTPMRPTIHLQQSPYLRQVLAQFHTTLGRARLMRLDKESYVPAHIDYHYHWRSRTRVHIPVATHPDVKFRCDGHVVHMAEGEAWTFDSWRMHDVVNETQCRRIHLVFDTSGSSRFWKLARPWTETGESSLIPYQPDASPELSYETCPIDPVMPPAEVDFALDKIAADIGAHPGNEPHRTGQIKALLLDLRRDWRTLWLASEPGKIAIVKFLPLLSQSQAAVKPLAADIRCASNAFLVLPILDGTFQAMLNTRALQRARTQPSAGQTQAAPASV